MKKLWEVDHPYYMVHGCFFDGKCHHEYDSFEDFQEEWGDADLDMNWIIRWDWEEFKPIDHDPDDMPEYQGDWFQIQIFLQRKAYPQSVEFPVTKEEEPKIREWLQQYADYMVTMWEPFLKSINE